MYAMTEPTQKPRAKQMTLFEALRDKNTIREEGDGFKRSKKVTKHGKLMFLNHFSP